MVVDVDLDDGIREGEMVREKDVERYSSDQVLVRVEGSFGRAFSGVGEENFAIGFGAGCEGDVEREVSGEGET